MRKHTRHSYTLVVRVASQKNRTAKIRNEWSQATRGGKLLHRFKNLELWAICHTGQAGIGKWLVARKALE